MPINPSAVRPRPDCPLVVAYGLGVDSTAMLVELARRHIQPDLILFADTGGEKPETYAYLPVIQEILAYFETATDTRIDCFHAALRCPSQPGPFPSTIHRWSSCQ
jgi:3'-phosphoadenosine 5'-phosphosulfate sulfotransferase (PAPS reductase)/FAD synthetase